MPKVLPLIVAVGVVLIALLSPALAARADEADEFRTMVAGQVKQLEAFNKQLEPLAGVRRIQDLIRGRLREGRLVVDSPLFDRPDVEQLAGKQWRATIDGLEGFNRVMVQPIGRTPAGAPSFALSLTNNNYPRGEAMGTLAVNLHEGYLLIVKTINTRGRNYTISFGESHGRMGFGQPDGVQLTVFGGDNRTGNDLYNVVVAERDFASLRRRHPREVEQHLRPLMRELKLENVFGVDPVTAWQVFADQWTPDAAMTARVRALLPELDAEDYRRRERARLALQELGAPGAMVVYRLSREGMSAEQDGQLDALLAAHAFLSRAEARRLGDDVDFLLDCLYSDDGRIRAIAARRLGERVHRTIKLDEAAGYAARTAQVETLRYELTGRTDPAAVTATTAPATRAATATTKP